MVNEATPFTPFPFNGPGPDVQPVAEPQAPKGRRGRRQVAKKTKGRRGKAKPVSVARPDSAEAAPAASPRTRKARKARPVKIDLAIAASVFGGLKQQEADMLNTAMAMLQPLNKKGRQRLVQALGKVFA